MPEQSINLVSQWHNQVARSPEAIALIDDAQGKAYTFAQMQAAAYRCAGYLRQHCQVQPGDGVLLLQPLSAQLYIALAAIWQLGAVAVLINPLLGQRYIEHCAQAIALKAWLGPPLLFASQLWSRRLRQIPHKLAIGGRYPGTISWQRVQQYPPETQMVTVTPETIALLSFTSGTTGLPKPIRRSHALLLAQYRALAPVLRWQPGAAELATLPLFGLANLVAGGTTVIPPVNVRRPARASGVKLRQTLHKYQISRLVAAPRMLSQLLKDVEPQCLPSLHQVFVGGAPLTQKLGDRLRRVAPQVQITCVYGSTEAEPIAVLDPNRSTDPQNNNVGEGLKPYRTGCVPFGDVNSAAGAGTESITSAGQGNPAPTVDREMADVNQPSGLLVGSPVPEIELCILHPETSRVASPYQPGEIMVRGAHVLNSPLPQHRVNFQGQRWHRTGDWGYLDGQGQLWLLGRTTAIIQDDRGALYPLAVECIANELPGVARSALVQWQGQRVLLVETRSPPLLRGAGGILGLGLRQSGLDRQYPPERGSGGALRSANTPYTTQLSIQVAWANLDHIIPVRRIPTDARHNAKVNYPRLQRWLRSPWGRWEMKFKTRHQHQD
ncbi:MAG: AMP-binding protein [Cyanobacteria bacterium P01_G01_bin.54]